MHHLTTRLFLVCVLCVSITYGEKFRVGIIGGGIGGSSAAYYLKSLLKNDVDITLFERNALGGRLATQQIGAHSYEAGGAIFIPRNRLIVQLMNDLGLQKRKDEPTQYSSLYDGKQVLFAEDNWKAVTIMKVLWRYGLGMYHLNSLTSNMLQSFDRIYSLQDQMIGYENLTSMLSAMTPSFVESLHVTAEDGFKSEGFSDNMVYEVLAAVLRLNYGQHLQAHKFVGAVSVTGTKEDLWAVEGGNKRIPQRAAEASNARIILQSAAKVVKQPSGKIIIVPSARSDIPAEETEFEFDSVIIAAPQTEDMPHRLVFQGFEEMPTFGGKYHRTVSTLLRGDLKRDYFPGLYDFTDEIITTKPGPFFNSISRIYPVNSQPSNYTSDVWKVFSQRPLTMNELSTVFNDIQDVTVVDWLAYPDYSTVQQQDTFKLAAGVYYINAIEWAASAMELSTLGARNVAILARNDWCSTRQCSKIPTAPLDPHEDL